MAKTYPRLSTVFIFIVCVIAVAAFSSFVQGQNADKRGQEKGEDIIVKSGSANAQNINSASDTNWQKQFAASSIDYKTGKPTQAKPTEKPLTLTDQIGRDFFTQYWQIHQAGLEGDEKIMANVTDRFAEQVAAAVNPVIYSPADIKISTDESQEAVIAYAKKVFSLLKQFPINDAATIANDALNNKEGSSLSQIDTLIKSYKSILAGMKTMPVPQTFGEYHLQLVNSISTILFNAEALRKVDVDPVRGLAAISIYIQAIQQYSAAIGNLQLAFNNIGITLVESSAATY